jgi:hypothetical protein
VGREVALNLPKFTTAQVAPQALEMLASAVGMARESNSLNVTADSSDWRSASFSAE